MYVRVFLLIHKYCNIFLDLFHPPTMSETHSVFHASHAPDGAQSELNGMFHDMVDTLQDLWLIVTLLISVMFRLFFFLLKIFSMPFTQLDHQLSEHHLSPVVCFNRPRLKHLMSFQTHFSFVNSD